MGFIAQALGLDRGGGDSAAQQRQMEIQQKQEERLGLKKAKRVAQWLPRSALGPVVAIASYFRQKELHRRPGFPLN